jgi:sucrose-6-phosphate hydrolase SacC (GH32 family)
MQSSKKYFSEPHRPQYHFTRETGWMNDSNGMVYYDGLQEKSIGFSNNRGRKWTKYPGNPVIPNPGLKDFRDPKAMM